MFLSLLCAYLSVWVPCVWLDLFVLPFLVLLFLLFACGGFVLRQEEDCVFGSVRVIASRVAASFRLQHLSLSLPLPPFLSLPRTAMMVCARHLIAAT